jgi:hypothetical protein
MSAILYQSFIVVVRAHPYPYKILPIRNSQSSIANANSGRPELSDFLEMKGGVPRVLAEEGKALVGQFPNLRR